MGSAFGFHGCGMLVDQNKCAYVAYWKTLTKRAFFVYFCSEIHNFQLCGALGALLDKHAYSAYFRSLKSAFYRTCSEILQQYH